MSDLVLTSAITSGCLLMVTATMLTFKHELELWEKGWRVKLHRWREAQKPKPVITVRGWIVRSPVDVMHVLRAHIDHGTQMCWNCGENPAFVCCDAPGYEKTFCDVGICKDCTVRPLQIENRYTVCPTHRHVDHQKQLKKINKIQARLKS